MPEGYRGPVPDARRWVEMCRRHMPHLDVRYVTREGMDIFTDLERSFLKTDNRHSPNRFANDAMYRELAGSGARIVMDGHGGDYTLNPRGQDALVRLLLTGRWRRFAIEFAATRRHLRRSTKQVLRRQVLFQLVPRFLIDLRQRYRSGLPLFGSAMPLTRSIVRSQKRHGSEFFVFHLRDDPRRFMQKVLCSQQDSTAIAGSVAAAAHGLEFTQPFHDKRVVEFGLAIPEALYFKNGKTRHLARAALKDLYPPEYQDRPPGNEGPLPDFMAMARRIEPRVLAEIERMEKAGYLTRYFDFSADAAHADA